MVFAFACRCERATYDVTDALLLHISDFIIVRAVLVLKKWPHKHLCHLPPVKNPKLLHLPSHPLTNFKLWQNQAK
jgi:hypothetical protein